MAHYFFPIFLRDGVVDLSLEDRVGSTRVDSHPGGAIGNMHDALVIGESMRNGVVFPLSSSMHPCIHTVGTINLDKRVAGTR